MPAHAKAFVVIVAAGIAASISGCTPDKLEEALRDTPVTTPSGAGFLNETDTEIDYSLNNATSDVDCGNGKHLHVGGGSSKLTVRGTCADVRVGGLDNTVALDKVDQSIDVYGKNCKVTYKSGNPTITKYGAGNEVTKA